MKINRFFPTVNQGSGMPQYINNIQVGDVTFDNNQLIQIELNGRSNRTQLTWKCSGSCLLVPTQNAKKNTF